MNQRIDLPNHRCIDGWCDVSCGVTSVVGFYTENKPEIHISQIVKRASRKLYLEIQLLREFGRDSFSLDKARVIRHSLQVERHASTIQAEI